MAGSENVGVYCNGIFWKAFNMPGGARSIPIRLQNEETGEVEELVLTITRDDRYGIPVANIEDESVHIDESLTWGLVRRRPIRLRALPVYLRSKFSRHMSDQAPSK